MLGGHTSFFNDRVVAVVALLCRRCSALATHICPSTQREGYGSSQSPTVVQGSVATGKRSCEFEGVATKLSYLVGCRRAGRRFSSQLQLVAICIQRTAKALQKCSRANASQSSIKNKSVGTNLSACRPMQTTPLHCRLFRTDAGTSLGDARSRVIVGDRASTSSECMKASRVATSLIRVV